ncbi:MAG: DUF1365 family protein [Vampirovibrionales bacterium]|nr:DUF1365 family protein [Vampirovibrionales bacterium]
MAGLNSCLYECEIYHHRLFPKEYRFKNEAFFFCLDLDEVPLLSEAIRLFNTEAFSLYSFWPSDYCPTEENTSLKQRIINAFSSFGLSAPISSIQLVSQVRHFGYGFNPLSLFFAYDNRQECVGVLAQVENTFREMKLFPVFNTTNKNEDNPPKNFHARIDKCFYVSPYSKADTTFDFIVSPPSQHIQVSVNTLENEKNILKSGYTGQRNVLNDENLQRFFKKYPLLSWQFSALIHWHAMRLWLKGLPFYWKGEHLWQQTHVLRQRPDLLKYYQNLSHLRGSHEEQAVKK